MNMADEGDVDSATLCSDAATVDGGSGERKRGGSGSSQSSPPPASVGVGGGSGSSPIPEQVKQTAKSRHRRRERALSTVDSPNRSRKIGGGGSLGYSMDGVSGEHSIVSFGMNFNFDSTSSPSNSDSGEAAEKEGEGSEQGSNNDNEDNNNNNNNMAQNPGEVGSGEDTDMRKKNKKSKRREGKGNTTGESSHHRQCPENGNVKNGGGRGGEEGSQQSTSSGSDSGENGGNASGGSNSGNDGSSGGKSTISSLTTSSNQEWMTAQKAEASGEGVEGMMGASAHGGVGEGGVVPTLKTSVAKSSRSTAQVSWNVDVGGGIDVSSSSKKRKKTSGTTNDNTKSDGGNEDDEGYKTDEEWGGSRLPNYQDSGTNNLLPGRGPLATHKGSSSSLKVRTDKSSSNKSSSVSSQGQPMKKARFSTDQQNLSSLSGSDPSQELPNTASLPIGTATITPYSSLGGQHALIGLSNLTQAAQLIMSHPSSSAKKPSAENAKSTDVSKDTAPDTPAKRKERNAREKERSCRIARQIDDLRALLLRGGVTVSKTTKSSVLSEAANYINTLQQQHAQWELEKQTLMQQMQQIGVIANPVALAINPVGDANAFPLVAQQPAVAYLGVQQAHSIIPSVQIPPPPPPVTNAINDEYKDVFNNSAVGMAIASLGGSFVDCNSIFCHLSEYSKEEVCAMTIFNMTSRHDLQHAFDLISQMITPTLDGTDKGENKPSIVLRGAMKNRSDLGLSIALIKGDHGIAKCFSVTLVRILQESTRQDSTSMEVELPQVSMLKQPQQSIGFGAPAYTAG